MSSSHALRLRLAPWALLLVSASWGLAFVVMKDAIERQSVNSFLFSRFSLAVVVMLLIKPSVVKTINGEILRKGFIAGLFLAAGYILQTLGWLSRVLQSLDLLPACTLWQLHCLHLFFSRSELQDLHGVALELRQ
jgi:drug/metabolite transporter (DMT)-like permease